ncbi:putative conserved membrane protein [Synechococcus sp. BIOS-U3-1]|nr:putative conserved membrane protein [Synechococcus sp. BIOS-U3-1]
MALTFKKQSRHGDRTGLKTTHPELLDENGFITKEELLVVHFGGIDGNALSVNS